MFSRFHTINMCAASREKADRRALQHDTVKDADGSHQQVSVSLLRKISPFNCHLLWGQSRKGCWGRWV